MADSVLSQAYPLDRMLKEIAGIGSDPQVTITDVRGRAVAQVFAKRSMAAQVEGKLGFSTIPGKASAARGVTFLPLAPGQWLAVSDQGNDGSFCEKLARKIRGTGHVSEQSDGRTVLRLSGPKARQVMEKACRLDLHPAMAGKGFFAQTQMAQIGVTLHQVSDSPAYELYVYPGFARHFLDFLWHCAAEYGVSVRIEGGET